MSRLGLDPRAFGLKLEQVNYGKRMIFAMVSPFYLQYYGVGGFLLVLLDSMHLLFSQSFSINCAQVSVWGGGLQRHPFIRFLHG